ncbi:AraC family transcriptional regulator [Paenibacillus hemerocallicola]|nr:AraC family transcriptional regulator [Paenibacillus hemerocallicola]
MSAVPPFTSCATKLKRYIHLAQRNAFVYSPDAPYDDWTMLICEDGLVEYRVGNRSGEARAGDIVLCPPGEVLHRNALTIVSFQFAIFELRSFSEEKEIPFPYYGKHSFPQMSQFLVFAEKLKSSRELISESYTEHLLNDALYQIVREKTIRQKQKKATDPAMAEAVRFIHQHVFDEVSTKSAADHVGMYQSQFTRKFQKEMGTSPSGYIAGLRLEKIAALLVETDDSLEKIAHQSGYQNAYYLSRVFSKAMKMSPSQYRRIHQV